MTISSSKTTRPSRTNILAISSLLLIHAWIALGASLHKSTTNDEIAHVTGGYTFNALGDFRIQPENGVLPQRWHALPLTWMNPQFPDLENEAWRQALAYRVSYDFFYRSGNDPDTLLFAGRSMNVFWGMSTLVLIAMATFRYFGPLASFFTTGLAALSPTLLAHSALATSDMAMTFFFLASVMVFWRHLQKPNLRTFILSSATFGLACVTKFSAVMLLPMMAIMVIFRCFFGPPVAGLWSGSDSRFRRLTNLVTWWAGHGLVAIAVIWLFFGFQFSMMSPDVTAGTMPLAWNDILSTHPQWEPLIFGLRDFHILPEAFLYGFSYVLAFSLARGAFLDGQVGTEGWVEFFPKTFLYKTPTIELVTIVLAMGVFVWWLRNKKLDLFKRAYLWIPGISLFVIYWVFSLTSHLNIGHRHILPTYPLIFIACGSVIWGTQVYFKNRTVPLIIGFGLLIGQALSTAAIHPHHLAYFNFIGGGPERGYQHLVDSSLDWGQDLPGLAKWLEHQQPIEEPVYLAYFGTGEPDHYGIDALTINRIPTFNPANDWIPFDPGYYAISATILQHAYRQNHQPWTSESEVTFQTLRNLESNFWKINGEPENHLELLDNVTPSEWHHAWDLYSELRFTRFCEYLKVRPPDAMVGYSILIFKIDQNELDRALHADLPSLINLIESTVDIPFTPEIH